MTYVLKQESKPLCVMCILGQWLVNPTKGLFFVNKVSLAYSLTYCQGLLHVNGGCGCRTKKNM